MFFAPGVLASSQWTLQAADISTQEYAGITCAPSDPGRCMCKGNPIGPSTYDPPTWVESNSTSIYDTSAPLFGNMQPLSHFRANATMVVNVASA